MYLVVRNYKNIKGNKQELSTKINNEFVPLISKIKGFVDYYCLMPDDNSLVSVSVFKDSKGANESVKAAADWVAKNLAEYFPEKPEVTSGEVFAEAGQQEIQKAA
jgi:hypothetical protein